LYARLNGMPGFAAATLAGKTVASGWLTSRYLLDGVAPARENAFDVRDDAVAPRYFETLQIHCRGRTSRSATREVARSGDRERSAGARCGPARTRSQKAAAVGFGVGPPLEVVGVRGT